MLRTGVGIVGAEEGEVGGRQFGALAQNWRRNYGGLVGGVV